MRMKPDIDEGWRARMDKTSAESKRIMEQYGIDRPRCGFGSNMGWYPTIERCIQKMIAAGWDKDLHQVKQKFCQLRIYIGAGMYESVDNPVKRFFRRPIVALASNQGIWPAHRKSGPMRIVYKIFSKIHIGLWDLSRTRLLREHKESKISEAIDEAERECDKLCEICGKERETKGWGWGMALCNSCGVPNEAPAPFKPLELK